METKRNNDVSKTYAEESHITKQELFHILLALTVRSPNIYKSDNIISSGKLAIVLLSTILLVTLVDSQFINLFYATGATLQV